MVNLMRKYQQGLLLIVTVIIIIAFAWLYNDYNFRSQAGDDSVGTIYDRPIKLGEFQRGLRRMQLANELGFSEMLGALQGRPKTREEGQANIVFGTYVLRHETDALGLVPTDVEVVEATKQIPVFQEHGQFDPKKYATIVQNAARLGFDAAAIEEVVRDDLRFQKLRDLFATTLTPLPQQTRKLFEQGNRKSDASVVHIKREDIAATIQVTDDEVKKEYEARKEGLKTDETRKVKVASFVLSEDEKKLTGADRGTALQKHLDQVEAFVASLAEPNVKFDDAAAKAGLKVVETGEFTQADPPAEAGDSPEVAEAAFKLTMEQPNSGAIRTSRDGYYVVSLTNITPARPQTFDEVKAKLTDTLKNERVQEALALKAADVRTKLEAEIKAGKSFADAAKALNLTPEKIEGFSPMSPPKPEVVGGREVMSAATEMEVGDLSEVIPTGTGSLIVHLDKHLPIDEAAYEKEKGNLTDNYGRFQVRMAFPMWFADRLKAANLVTKLGT